MSVASAAQQAPQKTRYTYTDYEKWPEYPRFELFNGEAVEMSAPTGLHQEISMELSIQFGTFLRKKKCKVYAAPYDVRINYNTLDNTVVQPDLVIVCDTSKIENGKHCLGAPDMVIEILSESTQGVDRLRKFNIYLNAGVREYWIVSPIERLVQVCILKEGEYTISAYDDESIIPVHVLEGCKIDMREVFPALEEMKES